MKSEQSTYEFLHYNILPALLVTVCTIMSQLLAVFGTTRDDVTWSLIGNFYSWTVVCIMLLWAYASLTVSDKEFKGPTVAATGYTPVYKANGLEYFCLTLASFVVLMLFLPQIAEGITKNFPQIIATCNIIAIGFCVYLLLKGKTAPEVKEELDQHPIVYEFYRGMELHPRLFGVDVKQFIICRFGMASWFLLGGFFFQAGWMSQEFSFPHFVCVALQIIYLGKFFWWETGYFDTIDIIYDRAGYYLCWGCLVWVPSFYTFSSYYLSSRPALVSFNVAWLIAFFGIISTVLNYWVDWEKQYFRHYDGRCRIWGKPATFIVASYKMKSGAVKKSKLLTSGFWGSARHLNYLFEILAALSWSLPAFGYGVWPFMYPIFITVLLLHRIFRDEKKCKQKYGKAWDEYCQKVPHRIIPGIV